MILEDHLGVVLGKACAAAGVEPEDAARFCGLSPALFQRLQETGELPAGTDLELLAVRLRLQPAKLRALADGWSPEPVHLGGWRELRQITTSADGLTAHCYLIWDEVSREAALFDTGWEAAPILTLVNEGKLQLKHIFLTHSHDDHLHALGALRQQFPKTLLHTSSKHAPPQHRNRPQDFIHLGSLRISNRELPGHTEESVCYLAGNWPDDAPHAVFCGDTIFAGSIATGHLSYNLLKDGIRTQLLSLPPATLLCPGHGPLTTVAQEKAHNPFFA